MQYVMPAATNPLIQSPAALRFHSILGIECVIIVIATRVNHLLTVSSSVIRI